MRGSGRAIRRLHHGSSGVTPRPHAGHSGHLVWLVLLVVIVTEHEAVESGRGCGVHAGHDVLVGVGGERVGVVAETFLDDLGVLAVGEQELSLIHISEPTRPY